jgi:hypothetical protein
MKTYSVTEIEVLEAIKTIRRLSKSDMSDNDLLNVITSPWPARMLYESKPIIWPMRPDRHETMSESDFMSTYVFSFDDAKHGRTCTTDTTTTHSCKFILQTERSKFEVSNGTLHDGLYMIGDLANPTTNVLNLYDFRIRTGIMPEKHDICHIEQADNELINCYKFEFLDRNGFIGKLGLIHVCYDKLNLLLYDYGQHPDIMASEDLIRNTINLIK